MSTFCNVHEQRIWLWIEVKLLRDSNLTLYRSGAKFNPRNGVMLTNLGIEYGRLKNFSYAERLYRTSIEVSPTHSKGYANLGGLMEALKRYDEAEWVST